MKKNIGIIMFFIVMVLSFAMICSADIQVLKNTNTDEVIMISEEMDIISNAIDDEIVILPHDIAFYNLDEEWNMYLLKNKKFSLNTPKITEINDSKKEKDDKKIKKDADSLTAKTKLIALGFTEDEANIILDIY